MPTFSFDSSTPNYVLMEEGHRKGPRLLADFDANCDMIYGFSNKAAYECFRTNCDVALAPYPLVKGYLRNQIAATGKTHKLVAIDVKGPCDPTLSASTMATVLAAQEEGIAHVTAAYLLTLDEEANAYRLAEVSAEA